MIRRMAFAGTTMEELRRAVVSAPQHENVVPVRADTGPLRFPVVCPNCGQAAGVLVRVERAFLFLVHSYDDSPNSTEQSIDTFHVPFCPPCARKQGQQQRPPNGLLPLRRVLSRAEGFAGLVVLAIGGMFIPDIL